MHLPADTVLHTAALTRWHTTDGLEFALDSTMPNWAAMASSGARVLDAIDGHRTLAEVAHAAALFDEPVKNLQHVTTFAQALVRAELAFTTPVAVEPYLGRASRLPAWQLRELWLHTNDACNLTCTHCLVSSSPDGSKGLPSERLLALIDEAKSLGVERVYFTGGEPFLRKDLPALVSRVTEHHGLELIVLTNGTLFDHPVYRAMLEPMNRQRVRFQVSIDGAEAASHDALRGSGAFARACAGLSYLSKQGFQTSLTTVPHAKNLKELKQLPALTQKLGAQSLHLMWPHRRGRAADESVLSVEALLDATREVRDEAARLGVQFDNLESLTSRANATPGVKHDLGMAAIEALCVGPDGLLYPSAATVGEPDLALGVLDGRSLLEVWQASPLAQAFRHASLVDNPVARADSLRFITGGFDIEHAWCASHRLTGDDPWAPLVTALTRDAIEALGRAGRARMNSRSAFDAPVLFHAMGEGALRCGDEVPGAVRTLHSNCVLSFDVDRPRALMRAYYGAAATEPRADLCCPVRPSAEDLAHIPKEVVDRFYGCGSPVQDAALQKGEAHLDLGSGAGIDVFIAAKYVGPTGSSVGVDMTSPMLEVANAQRPIVAANLGYDVCTFKKGVLEQVPLNDAAVDCVTSNCVVNLSPDKRAVFAEIWRVLKDHGRLVLADIVADAEVPPQLRVNPELWGECLSGALTEVEVLAELERAGFHGIEVLKKSFWREVQGCTFSSLTLRAWKLAAADTTEPKDHLATYLGPWKSVCDEWGQVYRRNEALPVSRGTAAQLIRAPYASSFELVDERGEQLAAGAKRCC